MPSSGPANDLNIRARIIQKDSPPEILVHGLVTPEDVDKLFEMCVLYLVWVYVHMLTIITSFFARLNVRHHSQVVYSL